MSCYSGACNISFIEWTSNLSVGVEDMDAEHMRWIAILNELHDAMNAGADQKAIKDVIDRMYAYSVTHLENEERYMEQIEYPLLQPHKDKHRLLIRRIDVLHKRALDNSKFSLTVEAIQLLKFWLTNHIMITDKKYGEYLIATKRATAS